MNINDFKEILTKQIEEDARTYPIRWARHRNGYPALRMKAIKKQKRKSKVTFKTKQNENIIHSHNIRSICVTQWRADNDSLTGRYAIIEKI